MTEKVDINSGFQLELVAKFTLMEICSTTVYAKVLQVGESSTFHPKNFAMEEQLENKNSPSKKFQWLLGKRIFSKKKLIILTLFSPTLLLMLNFFPRGRCPQKPPKKYVYFLYKYNICNSKYKKYSILACTESSTDTIISRLFYTFCTFGQF